MNRSPLSQPSLALVFALALSSCGNPPVAEGPQVTRQEPGARADQNHRPLRERSPEDFAALLAQFDDLPPGPARERLADDIDRMAGQRYATVSRLYWHTELEDAKQAARESGKPILSLRMLGRLDSDYSCANSRFFRVALYANKQVSDYLREHFVLHWSSERDIPTVTVDFGDGRKMVRTIAGNSAHYVLDQQGRVVDAIPGLYGPQAFLRELEPAREAARELGSLDDSARAWSLRLYHQKQVEEIEKNWQTIGAQLVFPPGSTVDEDYRPILAAERVAVSKAMIEVPVVRAAELGKSLDRQRWSEQAVATLAERAPERAHLDEQSRELMKTLAPSNWSQAPGRIDDDGLAQLAYNFENQLTAENLLNEYGLHIQIHRWLQSGVVEASFEELNARIYSELFLTPANDPWLGMATAGRFTGLPGDGLTAAR